MKILWMCNVKISKISEIQEEVNKTTRGGWLDGLSNALIKSDNVSLVCCYPDYNNKNSQNGRYENFTYYSVPMTVDEAEREMSLDSSSCESFKMILLKEKPDIVHFFGTEFIYTYYFIKVAKLLSYNNNIIISVQGLVSVYAKHYFGGLSASVYKKRTLSEFIRNSSIVENQKKIAHRGNYEINAIKSINHIIGRTSWDYACAKMMNPCVIYHFCNETLRKEFYSGIWRYNDCNPYQIVLSQGAVPYKGLHMVIEAVNLIKNEFPNLKVVVAGDNIFEGNFLKGNTYGNYVKNLINKYRLNQNIEFLGNIDANTMKKNMLKSNLFICPSNIENSPNSLGEAMILGVPCIAADVGGVQDMMNRNKEGFIYPYEEFYKLAYYIKDVFNNPKLAESIGENARKHALKTHDPNENNNTLIKIYEELLKNK